uniref:Slc46a-2 n=1 Tax=Schmidtea mediterranea TaxID=79327 RepID=A0A0H3YJM6_SCHMD|nr:slc46a-2 [Schmidtea mediterranea]
MNDDNLGTSRDELLRFSRQRSINDSEIHDKFVESFRSKRRCVTVEPLMLMYVVILYLQMTVMGQYVYYRVGKDLNLTTNGNLAYVCNRNVTGGSEKEKTDKLQEIYTYNTMFIQLSSSIFTILTAPFYSVFSDRFGRKLMFILPGGGAFVKSVIEILIIVYEWPLYIFVITEGFYGLFGGFNFATSLSYSYIADISTQKERTKRMGIMGVLMGLGALLVSLVSGIWIKYRNYKEPYIFTGVVALLCFLYPIFLLKEPPKINDPKKTIISPIEQMKSIVKVYWDKPKEYRALLILVFVLFNFYYVSEMSGLSLSGTYLMSYPICMDTIQLSIFGASNMLALNLGIGITIIFLSKFFSDLFLVFFCLLSGIAYLLQMAFAVSVTQVYIAAASNLFSFSAFPFIRGYMSKRMGPNEQGALFGGLALSETVCGAITKVITIYFYRETFRIFHGMVYLLLTGFSVIACVLILFALPIDRKLKAEEAVINIS